MCSSDLGQESSSDDEGSEESSVESKVEVRKEKGGKKEEARRTEEKKKVRGSNGPVPKPRMITKGAESLKVGTSKGEGASSKVKGKGKTRAHSASPTLALKEQEVTVRGEVKKFDNEGVERSGGPCFRCWTAGIPCRKK